MFCCGQLMFKSIELLFQSMIPAVLCKFTLHKSYLKVEFTLFNTGHRYYRIAYYCRHVKSSEGRLVMFSELWRRRRVLRRAGESPPTERGSEGPDGPSVHPADRGTYPVPVIHPGQGCGSLSWVHHPPLTRSPLGTGHSPGFL